jgi:hypothetical protein
MVGRLDFSDFAPINCFTDRGVACLRLEWLDPGVSQKIRVKRCDADERNAGGLPLRHACHF